ncbi:FIST N-terminal domain-containing protein [Methylosinus sp. Sm6]|uniref:FIST signal transduction protein n=1 Tax=Methylosinus sp. Sm6 TaxID=2866948 RepID=UPI001C99A6FB|nr:FIST N-terminal domain-containing protein [Methylosinus sp. Sm6]MBY6243230.1 FIST C-terminal domain-containing protein [Methylosinus sp. Sm6]
MSPFLCAHAGDPDWGAALRSCLEQIGAGLRDDRRPNLGWCYITDYYTPAAASILAALKQQWPGVHWVGTVGVGIAADATEYFDAPAMALMLGELPPGSFRLFSEAKPWDGFEAFTALVHADGGTPDLQAKLKALSATTATGYLFGGLSSARNQHMCFADEPLTGGVSGVAFGPEAPVISRVTQGCQPIGPRRTVTRAEGNYLVTLDNRRSLDCVLEDLGLDLEISDTQLGQDLAQTLVGVVAVGEDAAAKPGQFGANAEVRHIIGVGRKAGLLVVPERLQNGSQVAFCKRNVEAARNDLLRIVEEVRAQASSAGGIRGALYVSCSGRGGPHFGAPNAEFEMVREALGPAPLIGFFAGGEIARHHLYGYTGVLTVFAGAA